MKSGYNIEFASEPCVFCNRSPINFNLKEQDIISKIIKNFEEKGVIVKSHHEPGEIISHIFIRPKADGSHRLILNLSKLNDHVEKITFKMETLKSALQMIRPGCFFSKVDLKEAFYSIGINRQFQKYLKFLWQGTLYVFTCLPNGLSTASRIFTKVLKPVFAALRKMGHLNVAYIDDSLLQSYSYEQCLINVKDTVRLIDSVGLTIHPEKSMLIPVQCIEFVGFLLNSKDMTVRLAPRKIQNFLELACSIRKAKSVSIRELAKLIGKMVAAEPGVKYAALHYKTLELEKASALKLNRGNFNASMCLSIEAKQCIKWWIDNIETAFRPISLGPMNRRIETDSSLMGYGGFDVTNEMEFSGIWGTEDKLHHINFLELKAAFVCLKHFCHMVRNEHIYLFMDNTVAIKYISKMGGRKSKLNELAKQIWEWCEIRNIWLSVFHIPSHMNFRADRLSRLKNTNTCSVSKLKKKCHDDMEWALEQEIYQRISDKMGHSEVDLFASAKNYKHKLYISYIPDYGAIAVNAFSILWNYKLHYAFPPFSIIGRVLQKMCEDKAEIILVAPLFPSQPWFPQILQQISGPSFVLPKTAQILYLPGTKRKHRLTTMRLGAFKLSGNALLVQEYRKKLQISSCSLGDQQQQNSMGAISKDGCNFVMNKRLIKLTHL